MSSPVWDTPAQDQDTRLDPVCAFESYHPWRKHENTHPNGGANKLTNSIRPLRSFETDY